MPEAGLKPQNTQKPDLAQWNVEPPRNWIFPSYNLTPYSTTPTVRLLLPPGLAAAGAGGQPGRAAGAAARVRPGREGHGEHGAVRRLQLAERDPGARDGEGCREEGRRVHQLRGDGGHKHSRMLYVLVQLL